MARKILSIETERMIDEDPDTSYLEQEGFEKRLDQYKRGVFGFMGIRAKAVVQLNGALTQTITSGGLWGIEDDSGFSTIKEYSQEELADLRDQLLSMGFSKRAIKAATPS